METHQAIDRICKNIDKQRLIAAIDAIIASYNMLKHINNAEACIVIGANPSILQFNARDTIDKSNAFIMRVNSIAQQKFLKNYGSKADLYIGCRYLQHQLSNASNKILLEHSQILDISKHVLHRQDIWLTTGFIAMLIAAKLFKKVELFGFGMRNQLEDQTTYKSILTSIAKVNHLINVEHALIQHFIDYELNGKLSRFEDNHLDLAIMQ